MVSKENEDKSLDEATKAAETLKPGGAKGQSRAEMLSTFTTLMNQIGKEDFSHWFNDSIAQIGKEAKHIDAGAAEKNRNTIKAIKEDIADLFAGDETLSEDFIEKAGVVFEAFVNSKIQEKTIELEEAFEAKEAEAVTAMEAFIAEQEELAEAQIQEEVNDIFEEVTMKLDGYLDHVVETWFAENEVAIENTLRADIAEDFMEGLKNLFAEKYIEVPEDRLDVMQEMQDQIDALTDALNETIDSKMELEAVISEATKSSIVDEVADGLVETQAEKLRDLAEGLEFTDIESFTKKVSILKESHFDKGSAKKDTGLLTETIGGEDTSTSDVSATGMDRYVNALSKITK